MHRRSLFAGAAIVAAAALAPGAASAETPTNSYGSKLDQFIASRPGLREIVAEEAQHLSRDEIIKTLEALKELSENPTPSATPGTHEEGATAAPEIVPMRKVCVKVYGWMMRAFAWDLRLRFGAVTLVGTAVGGTIVGLPAGLVLGALGMGGSWTVNELFNWIDSRSWPRNVCVTVS